MNTKKGIRRLLEEHLDACPFWRYDEENELYYPIFSLEEELPDEGYNFFTRAEFISPIGLKFRGYLVGNTENYCIAIFYKKEKYMFNKNRIENCLKLTSQLISEISSPQVKKVQDVFPLKYTTTINLPEYN